MRFLTATVVALVTVQATLAQGIPMNQIAKGTFEVKLAPLPFEGAEPETTLGRMSIDKQISGDLTASTKGQMLSAMTGTKGSR